ncbi:hypothetical protein KC640_01075 [Candidatus Dojkabacteria bacterium]|uniref:Uncharacterized protein n=1 Tax=Candidatus Dojkabacteria bacterium TaxID=2099670 RepID=A0A955I767_9BACT|nr:hypothetical protein [Candidatus Dojkabacteria bacterium]
MDTNRYPLFVFLKEVFLDWNSIFGNILNTLFIASLLTGLFADEKLPYIILALTTLVSSSYRVWLAKYYKLRETEENAIDIQIGIKKVKASVFLELFNSGQEDVRLVELKVRWQQPEGPQERVLTKFLNTGANITTDAPSTEEFLASRQRLLATEIPSQSSDNKLEVLLSVEGLTSKRQFKTEWIDRNYNSYEEKISFNWI